MQAPANVLHIHYNLRAREIHYNYNYYRIMKKEWGRTSLSDWARMCSILVNLSGAGLIGLVSRKEIKSDL